jgi:hypothetical protein
MSFPHLDIRQTFIRMGFDIQRPSYTFEPANSNVEIEQKPAEMILNPIPSRLTIDQSQCWADMDLKSAFQRISEAASDGQQAALEYVGKTAEDGARMAAIETGENVFQNLAREAHVAPQHSFQFGNIPGNFSLHMQFTPGELNMDWQLGGAHINVQTTPAHQRYEMGNISYYIQQKNQLQIDVVGSQLNVGM